MDKTYSVLDAFMALKDLDEEVEIKVKEKKLNEASSFSVNDEAAMEAAEKLREKKREDVALEVVDSNADDEAHLKNNSDYVGDKVLICNKCQSSRIVPTEVVDTDPATGDYIIKEDNELDYTEECPVCHTADATYRDGGIVAASVQPEPAIENDVAAEEPKFDNDVAEEPAQPEEAEEPAKEDNPDEWGGFEQYDAADDLDYTDTDAPDDTEDVEDKKLGDEFDADDDLEPEAADFEEEEDKDKKESLHEEDEEGLKDPTVSFTDDVAADDTEPEEEPEEEPVADSEEPIGEEEVTVEEPIGDKSESLYTVKELLDSKFILPEEIKDIIIYDMDLDKELFRGKLSEMSRVFRDAKCSAFEVTGKNIIANIAVDGSEGCCPLSDALADFKGENVNITVYDRTTDMELAEGKPEDVLGKFGKFNFVGYEIPGALKIIVRSDAEESEKVEESLVEKIVKFNGGNVDNINRYGTNEYWINEDLNEGIELDKFVESYLINADKALFEEFCEATGYKAAREVIDEDLDQSIAEAKALLKDSDAFAVIHGYTARGKFYPIKPIICKDDKELKDKTEICNLRYKPQGSLHVIYQNDLDEGCKKESLEEDTNTLEFKTRKELSAAIQECRNNKQPYVVKRSLKEGYRWTLIKEDIDDEEESWADKLADELELRGVLVGDSVDNGDGTINLVGIERSEWDDVMEFIKDEYGFDSHICNDDEICVKIDESLDEGKKKYHTHVAGDPVQGMKDFNHDMGSGEAGGEGFGEELEEPLDEAKKEEELPAAPDAVKTEVHRGLVSLKDDEIEAIDGYNEIINQVQDVHIEHKDDIIDELEHIKSEEEEHIDEIDALASEIPFDSEHVEEKEEPEEEPEEEVPSIEDIPLDEEPIEELEVEESLKESNEEEAEPIEAKKFEDGDKTEVFTELPDYKVEVEQKGDKIEIELEPKEPSEEEVPAEELPEEEEFDEALFENFLNNYFDEAYEDTILFEARDGYVDEKGNILIEGVLTSGDNGFENKVKFTLTPEKTINESTGNEETHYTVTNNLSEEVLKY